MDLERRGVVFRSVRRGDVMSAWSGLRPLVRDINKKDTKSLARNHIIEVDPVSNLVTIAGGKWTTYRHMASVLKYPEQRLPLAGRRNSQQTG